jgi:hypothetical protein
VKGINEVIHIILIDHGNHTAADSDEVGLRYAQFSSVAQTEAKGAKLRPEPFGDVIKIDHGFLSQRRLRFGLFHYWLPDRLALFDKLDLAHRREAGAGRDQVTHDHVFLKAAQFVDFA